MFLNSYAMRLQDDFGCGNFGASRGKRTHNGIDYCAEYGEKLISPISGRVSKIGYPYSNDLRYRYVEITDVTGLRHRVFYVQPHVDLDDLVIAECTCLGTVQDIALRYKHRGFMHNHFHYEVKDKKGLFINPESIH